MRLLADESCDFSVVRDLRIADHDVLSITETLAGAQLVYAAASENSGIVLIRYPSTTRARLVHAVLHLLATQGDSLYNSFVVMEPGRVRLGRPAL